MSRALWWSQGAVHFLKSEVPLYGWPAAIPGTYPDPCWGTSLISKRLPLGPYIRAMPRALWWF